jgi:hypothetical protein
MTARRAGTPGPELAWLVALTVAAAPAMAPRPLPAQPASARPPPPGPAGPALAAAAAAPSKAPRAYLIHLIDGRDPIVVKQYVEEGDEIRFEKFGGWVGIPKYEVLRIVPDDPDAVGNLPPPPPPDPTPDLPVPGVTAEAQAGMYVSLRGGADVKATAVAEEGERVRVTVPDGSFTVDRSDLIGVVRVSPGAATHEAWLTVLVRDRGDGVAAAEPAAPAARPADGPPGDSGSAPTGSAPTGSAPGPSSDRPHLLHLASGQVIRVEGFWVENGEIRFRRLGGLIGLALAEIARIVPEELAPVAGRMPVRYARQLGPDVLEVRARREVQRIRLIGVEPVPGAQSPEDPLATLERGVVLYLEFDRQRYDPAGDWLAYVFLPSGRMLNAELIRLGLARPRADRRNLRYVDLFQEIAQLQAARPPDPE